MLLQTFYLFIFIFYLSVRSHSNQFIVATVLFPYFQIVWQGQRSLQRRRGRGDDHLTVIRTKAERVRLANEVRKEVEKAKGGRREKEQARQVREETAEKKGPPLLCTTPPQPKSPHPQGRWSRHWMRLRGGLRRLDG